jgi:hypothetical protein
VKKINSIGYGGGIATVAIVFLIAVPLCLQLVGSIWTPVPAVIMYISLAIGGLTTLFLIALLTIEFKQDKRQNRFYRTHAHVKLPLGNGRYECQSCGSRDVSAHDTACRICGIQFGREDTP